MRVDSYPRTRFFQLQIIALTAALPMLLVSSEAACQGWVLESVDASANILGQYTSIELDAAGNPRVSYWDVTPNDLKYASKSGGEWTIETADASASSVGSRSSLALDASGNPHVCYMDGSLADVKYARKSGAAWTLEVVDGSATDAGYTISLALDGSGNPHVTYYENLTGDLKYARKSGGIWTRETADGSANDVGLYNSLALDASGNPHISYFDDTTDDVKYARKSGGVWTREIVDGAASALGWYTSIALDAAGNTHVSYYDPAFGDLKYARRSGGVWTRETADGSVNISGVYNSLALDASGGAHLSYYDATANALKYLRKSGGVWTRETVGASTNDVGSHSSLALDAAGSPHVSYYDATDTDLKYAFVPSLIVGAPGGGTTWAVGSSQTVSWSYTGGVATDVSDVFLSVDGGRTFDMIRDNTRDFSATVRVPHAPTRFAQIKIVQPSPFVVGYSDSFFTIDATITLDKFDARDIEGSDDVALSWETTPGREAEIRYRVERATGDGASAQFTPLTFEPLDANEYVDAVSAASASASGARYRLIAINGLGEEYTLGEARVALALAADRRLGSYPNPSRDGRVEILYRLPSERSSELAIYDSSGRRVRGFRLTGAAEQVGSLAWDGRDDDGREVAAGTYLLRLSSDSGGTRTSSTERVVIVR